MIEGEVDVKNSHITGQQKSRFNLLALPPLQRRVLVYLAREGPTNGDTLAHALDQAPAALQATLTALLALGAITLTTDGRVEAQWGRKRRRTLPARLWPALQTASRLYSAQEIVTLRTVVPILQFRARQVGGIHRSWAGSRPPCKTFCHPTGSHFGVDRDRTTSIAGGRAFS